METRDEGLDFSPLLPVTSIFPSYARCYDRRNLGDEPHCRTAVPSDPAEGSHWAVVDGCPGSCSGSLLIVVCWAICPRVRSKAYPRHYFQIQNFVVTDDGGDQEEYALDRLSFSVV